MDYQRLHEELFVLDSHCDTPLRIIEGGDICKEGGSGHVDFPSIIKGGVDAIFFAIYTSNKLSDDQATVRALKLIASVYDSLDRCEDNVAIALTKEDAVDNKKLGVASVFLGMENGAPIQKDLSLLRLFYDMGIRYMTLTHAGNNEICDSCATKEKRWNGLSPFGIEVVAEMNRLGMLIDVSHLSDKAFYDVLKYSQKPVVATHSCCRSLADLPRNMSDDMIRDLAAKGGVIQINFYPPFLDKDYADKFWPLCDKFEEAEELYKSNPLEYKQQYDKAKEEMFAIPRPSYKVIVDHIDHVVSLVGAEHVGLGSDFDGIEVTPQGLENISMMPLITKELLDRGYNKEQIAGIMGENFLRLID